MNAIATARRPAYLGSLVLLGAVVAVPVATQAPAAAAACAPGTGVTVVVDFGSLGGGVRQGCDPDGGGKPASRVVPEAGFPLTYVATEPFVCRISGLPDASREDCANTPPADAYWAVFWSDGKKGTWTYASTGVTSLDVPAGGSIGFKFQSSGSRTTPGAPPNPAPPPKPQPTKPTKPPKPTKPDPEPTKAPTTPAQPSGTPSDTPAGTPSGSPTAADTKAERAERAAQAERAEKRAERRAQAKRRAEQRAQDDEAEQSATPSGTPTEDAQVAADGPAEEETPLTPASATEDGNGALTWLAGGAVLLLAVAAGVLARRRRG